MGYPPLVIGLTEAEYRRRFELTYCRDLVSTFDGIAVRFRKRDFDHAFFESSSKRIKDDRFSVLRAERIDWVKAALQDPDAELYVGFDNKRKRPAVNRRVAVVLNSYVVVIAMTGQKRADFVTAFVDTGPLPGRNFSSLQMIRMGDRWSESAYKNR